MSNIDIEYKYRTVSEIMEKTTALSNFSLIEIGILILLLVCIITLVIYIAPLLENHAIERKKEIEKKKKKLSLQQILVTKEIEQEIENEIKEEQEARLKAKFN